VFTIMFKNPIISTIFSKELINSLYELLFDRNNSPIIWFKNFIGKHTHVLISKHLFKILHVPLTSFILLSLLKSSTQTYDFVNITVEHILFDLLISISNYKERPFHHMTA